MSNSAAAWREQGIAAARARDRAGAQEALLQAVRLDPRDEQAWFWLAAVQTEPQQTAYYLERVLEINPEHSRARAGLEAARAQLGQSSATPPTARTAPGVTQAPPFPAPPPAPLPSGAGTGLPWDTPPPAAGAARPPAPPTANLAAGLPWALPEVPSAGGPPGADGPPTTTIGAAEPEMPAEELVRAGIEAAQAGRRVAARKALLEAVERDEHNADAWYWLSTVVDEPEDREIALENTLALNPDNRQAKMALIAVREGAGAVPSEAHAPPGTGGLGGLRRPAQAPPHEPLDEAALAAGGAEPPLRHAGVTAGGEVLAGRLPRPPFEDADTPAPPTPATLPPFVMEPPAATTASTPAPSHPSATPAMSDLSTLRTPSRPSHQDQPAAAPTASRVGTGYEALVGQVIGGRYRVMSLFAQGTSTLLMATDVKRGNMVLLRPERDLVGSSVRKGVKPAFMMNNTAFYMSNINLGGLNLRNFLGTVGTMPTVQIIEYGLRLCMEAKKRGLLLPTRYWSPETLTVDEAGRLAVVAPPESMDRQARPGVFSPPEQAAGGKQDERSDVYLIGAILFFLATGTPPPAPDRVPTPQPHLDRRGRPVPGVVEAQFPMFPNVDPLLGGVLATALQGEPGLRYKSVEQLSGALTGLAAATKEQLKALPVQRLGSEGRSGSSGSPLVRVLALLGLAVAGAVLIYLLVLADQALNLGALFSGPAGTAVPPTATSGAIVAPPATATAPAGEPTATINPAFAPPVAASLDRVTVAQVDAQAYPQIVVYASVLSADGRPVVNLAPEQWTVTNDGQPVTDFQFTDLNSQPEPISTFLVLDTSAKMAGAPLEQAQAAISQFVDRGQPGDSLGLATFNDTAQVVQPFTVGRERVKAGVAGLTAQGGAALWDALSLALQPTSAEKGRRAIILLSAGPDTVSQPQAAATVLTETQRAGLPIYIVGLHSEAFDPQTLAPLAQQTGGALLTADAATALPGLYQQVGNRLAAQYRITFTVSGQADRQPRTVALGVTVDEKTVQDTRQYFVR